MNKMKLNKGGKIGLLMLMVAAVLVASATASFAVTDQTWLKTAAGGQVSAAGNCRFIAVAKGDDSYVMTEDDGGATYADSNGAYVAAGTSGFAKTDSTHWSTGWVLATDTYAIWVSSIADGQSGTASGTIGSTSPNYTTPGTNASQLSLATTNYMAAPANFKVYTGNAGVLLKWDAVTGATKYRVFRGPVTGNSNSLYARMGTTTGLCYQDSSLTNGTKYFYIVVPMNASNWYGVHTNQVVGTPDATTAPTITSLSSTTLTVGSSVTITGTNFNAAQGTGFVEFNGLVATITSWSATSIVATVPAGTTAGNVCVVNSNNRVSNGSAYTMAGAASFTSITPSSGYQGDTLTAVAIVGTNTNFVNGTTTVSISGANVTVSSVTVTNATHLTCNIAIAAGAAAGARNVVVATGAETVTGTGSFTVKTPAFGSVTPASGAQGANLTGVAIVGTGTHFSGTPTVTFSGAGVTSSNISVTDATHLTCNVAVAAGAALGARNIVVITGSETVTGTSVFTVGSAPVPTVTNIFPSSGASPNTGITITGTNFTGTTSIVIGATAITTYTVSSATSITGVSIPAGLAAGAYDIMVTNAAGQSAINSPADQYTVTSAPSAPGQFLYEGAGGIMMAYPNPFNPNDKAHPLSMLFSVTTGEAVDIYIFDTNGRMIYQDRDSQTNASRTVTWDGDTSYGETVENGLYLIRVVKDGKLVEKGKILVIKK